MHGRLPAPSTLRAGCTSSPGARRDIRSRSRIQIRALSAGITDPVGSLLPDSGRGYHHHAAASYIFTGHGLYGGLDQCAPAFAPCLLGCSGTGRQDTVLMSLRLAGLRYCSACHSIPVTQVFKKLPLSSGLLIRGFGVQISGGAPGKSRHYMCLLLLFSGLVGPRWVRCGTRPESNLTGLLFIFGRLGRPARRGCAGSPSPGCPGPSPAPASALPGRSGAALVPGAGRPSAAGRGRRAGGAGCRAQRGRHRPVGPRQPRSLDLTLERGHLMAQDQDLGALGTIGPGEQGEPAEHAQHHHQVGESHRHEYRQCPTRRSLRSQTPT